MPDSSPNLRVEGYDVTRVGTDYPGTLTDREVLATAVAERRILITDDRDFGELVFVHRQPQTGVIYFRLSTTRFSVRRDRLDDVLANHRDDLSRFLVVTELPSAFATSTTLHRPSSPSTGRQMAERGHGRRWSRTPAARCTSRPGRASATPQ